MSNFNSVLIANDQLEGMDTALSKAAVIEHYTGCRLALATVSWNEVEDEELPGSLKAELIENYVSAERHGLRQLSEQYRDKVADIDFQAIWARQPDDAIIELQQQLKADLIIKPACESELLDFLFAPLDWRLIRNSRCPVLISKSTDWKTGGVVLASMDVGNPKHEALNQRIATVASTMAKTLDAKLHLVTAYPDLGQGVNERQVAMDYAGLKADMRAHRLSELEKISNQLLEESGQKIEELHVLEGKAQRLVAHLAHALDATVTVIGTHARVGVGKWLLGNTAEKLLPRMHGDVLTVRPLDE